MKSLSRLAVFWRQIEDAPLSARLLISLAFLTFTCSGLYLSLFTNGGDFALTHGAGAAIAGGRGAGIYDHFFAYRPGGNDTLFFMYPPPVAMLYAPLGALPFEAALGIFELLMLTSVLTAILIWTRHRGLTSESKAYWIVIAAPLLFFPLSYSFQLGQNEALIFLSLVVALAVHRRSAALAGLAIALAITLKIFLGLIVVYLIVKRRWRLVLWVVTWGTALFALSLVFVPWIIQAKYYMTLFHQIGIESFYDNQSLTGLFYRSLTNSAYTRGIFHSPYLARVLTITASTFLFCGFLYCVLRDASDDGFEEGFALTLISALLLSPHSDTHHQAILLIPLLLLFERPHVGMTTLFYYSFFAVFPPIVAFHFLSHSRLAALSSGWPALIYSLPTFAMMGLWLHTASVLRPLPVQET